MCHHNVTAFYVVCNFGFENDHIRSSVLVLFIDGCVGTMVVEEFDSALRVESFLTSLRTSICDLSPHEICVVILVVLYNTEIKGNAAKLNCLFHLRIVRWYEQTFPSSLNRQLKTFLPRLYTFKEGYRSLILNLILSTP